MVKIQLQSSSRNGQQANAFKNRVTADGGTFEAFNCLVATLDGLNADIVTGGYLDVKEDTAFPLNFGVADIRDISQKAGAFSKTITLLGTKNNHDLLGHYYDVNLVEGTFNINTITKCIVLQNDIPILADANIQLISVNKVQTNDAYEQGVEYSVLIKDQTSTFFTKLDNKELKDIDYSDLNHTISSSTIYATFNNTSVDGYKYGLNWSGDNIYPIKEFAPAIYAKTYFDRIFASSGFSYTWANLSDCRFDKCIIPYNGDVVKSNYSGYLVNATHAADIISITQAAGSNVSFKEVLDNFTEVQDNANLFTPLTGSYISPFTVTGGESITFAVTIEGDIELINATGSTAYLVEMISSSNTVGYTYQLQFAVYVNGAAFPNMVVTSSGFAKNEGSLANGTTLLGSIDGTYNVPVANINAGDDITIRAGVRISQTVGSIIQWRSVNATFGGSPVVVTPQLNYTSLSMLVNVSSNLMQSGSTININDYVPNKIKQKDFIKSIFTMFNLYAETDAGNPNTLILKTRDDYYDSGVEKDWSKKLAKDDEQTLQFLPELSAKKLVLTYKQDTDLPNVTYYDATREVYGQAEFIFDNEYVKGTDTKEIIFSPTPISKTVFNAYVPMVAGSSPKANIRILYDSGIKTCSPYNIIDAGAVGLYGILEYPLFHHFDDALNPTFDLNFALCDYLFYDGYTTTNNGLYNNFWRRTINQINTGKMLVAMFDLDEYDIQTLRLNDKIYIDNSWWSINKIIDYNANNRQLTKVELLSTDNEIDFARFLTRPTIGVNPTGSYVVTKEINNIISNNNNTVVDGADVLIKGRNNIVVGGVKALIEGDNGVVNEDGIYRFVDGLNVNGDNFATADLNFTGDRFHSTAGHDLNITTDNGAYLESYIYMTPSVAEIGNLLTYTDYTSTKAFHYGGGNYGFAVSADGAGFPRSITTSYIAKTANYTITSANYLIDCTSNTFTVTLPTASGIDGRTYIIKNSGAGVITLEGDGTETIDGALNLTLATKVCYTVISDGANWIIINAF